MGEALHGMKCTSFCSEQFDGTRYCGTGGDYESRDSVDCSNCKCPEDCASPTCQAGSPSNGGEAITDGKCMTRCSRFFSGVRYCGAGADYEGDDTVDCAICGEGAPLQEHFGINLPP